MTTQTDPEADLQYMMRLCSQVLGQIGNLRQILDHSTNIEEVHASQAYREISKLHDMVFKPAPEGWIQPRRALDRYEQPKAPIQDREGRWRNKDGNIVCKCGQPAPINLDECDECATNL